MLGSFDECKGSASLIQSLLHSLPMTAKIVHETFLLYLVIFFIDHKKTQLTHYQEYTQRHRNLPQLKKMALKQNYNPRKRDFGCRKSAFSPSLPLQIPSKPPVPSSPHGLQSTPLRPIPQTKDSFFLWRHTPSVERSTTMSKNSSAFYAEQTTFRQKSSSFSLSGQEGKERRLRYVETT